MAGKVTIAVPIPDRCLSPNARAHWAKKARAKKAQREAAYINTLRVQGGWRGWDSATIDVKWYGRTKNAMKLDHDNIIASLKGTADGLQDAGLIKNDQGLRWNPPTVAVDKANPRVEITVTNTGAKE